MILLTGPEEFEFARRSVGPSRPLERLAKVSRAGELMAVVDRYEIDFADGSEQTLFLGQVCKITDSYYDEDSEFYCANDLDTEPDDLFEELFKSETEKHVGLLREKLADRSPTRIQIFAHVQYRIMLEDGEGETMLEYLNDKLPEEAQLTLEEIAGFDPEAMIRFDPEEDEPNREDGTGFVKYFLENDEEDDGLPLLGLCILAHGVVHDIPDMFVYEEPIYSEVVWRADGVEDEDEEDNEENDEDEDDEDDDE
ncbi:MAG TPA: hypothetical protein PK156_33960 [Polyangium sp.]|nr:hypothetical protein [Polyangium sp.]